jgi:hypothetical protein
VAKPQGCQFSRHVLRRYVLRRSGLRDGDSVPIRDAIVERGGDEY